ncbi:hypothetical protein KC322_g18580, partial [Hortaea werneckii]
MLSRQASAQLAPLVLRNGTRTAFQRGTRFPRYVDAVALLVPRRAYQSDTSTGHGQDGNHPPPGFNLEEAKRPPPKDQSDPKAQVSATDKKGGVDVEIPTNEATERPPTQAEEARTLSELADRKAAEERSEHKKEVAKKEEKKKMTLWQRVKHEAHHYWDGTKLLATEVRISSKLALKMAAG